MPPPAPSNAQVAFNGLQATFSWDPVYVYPTPLMTARCAGSVVGFELHDRNDGRYQRGASRRDHLGAVRVNGR